MLVPLPPLDRRSVRTLTVLIVLATIPLAGACGLLLRGEPVDDAEIVAVRAALAESELPGADKYGVPVDTLDRRVLVRWLKQGQYDSLSHELSARWQATRQDIRNEMLLYNAYESFFQNGAAGLQPHLTKWAEARPGQAEPLVAEAYYRYGRAYESRGTRSIGNTSEEEVASMMTQVAEGRAAADRALQLAPGHVFAHFVRLNLMRMGSVPDQATAINTVQSALTDNPASFLLRDEIMVMLQPRWGGSLDAMRAFAEASREFIPVNPKLVLLPGRVPMEEARLTKDYGMSLALLDQAATYGEDYHLALAYTRLYDRNNEPVKALEASQRAQSFIPQGRSHVAIRGQVLLRVAILLKRSPLRDSLFEMSGRSIALAAQLATPNEDPASHLESWKRARRHCELKDPEPCGGIL